MPDTVILKDDKLKEIIENEWGNVAQFISVDSNYYLKYAYINDISREYHFSSVEEALECLINHSGSKHVNVRTFKPSHMKGNEMLFNKNIDDFDEIVEKIKMNCAEGYTSIINENIDINDGGVSGVRLGEIVEFSPFDTPKAVDKPGVCALPVDIANILFKNVYGFEPDFRFAKDYRVEFSIHPQRQGLNKSHTIIWEYEQTNIEKHEINVVWPNNFSRMLGDKTFGLLLLDALGFLVPRSTVISRSVAPFTFGTATNSNEKWLRTSPVEKAAGKYTTTNVWEDPFLLLQKEDPKGTNIASIISQDSVEGIYSGAAIIGDDSNDTIIEGVKGKGDDFMIGIVPKEELPSSVINSVSEIINELRSFKKLIGNVSIEWVYDGIDVWIVQMNQVKRSGFKNTIVPGEPQSYINFDVKKGLDELRDLIKTVDSNTGIILLGKVGITSHFGDLLRQANIPSKIKFC